MKSDFQNNSLKMIQMKKYEPMDFDGRGGFRKPEFS